MLRLFLATTIAIGSPQSCHSWSLHVRHALSSPTRMRSPTRISTRFMNSSRRSYEACDTAEDGIEAQKQHLHVDSGIASEKTEIGKLSVSQQILKLAIPALVSLSLDPLMTLADTAFVGRYAPPDDPSPLAGLGSAASLLVFSFYIFNFLATATAPLVANRRASNDEMGASRVAGQALTFSILLGILLAVCLLVYREPMLKIMGTGVTGPDADQYAQQFLIVRALAAPAVLVCSASNGILRGYLDTTTPTIILLWSNLVNLILDVVLVAYMKLGPMGAGIATTCAEYIASLSFLGVLGGIFPTMTIFQSGLRNQEDVRLEIMPSWELPKWLDVQPLIVASSAVFLRSVVLQVAMSSAAAMAARSSSSDGINISIVASSSVAAHQIALQLWLLCSFLCDALATASQALVADGIGRRDSIAVQNVSRTVFQWGLVLGLILSFALFVGTSSGFLLDLFTSDEGTRSELSKLLTIVIFAQPLNSFVFAADGVLQGAEQFVYQAKSMALSVVTAIVIFELFEYTAKGQGVSIIGSDDTLVHVWYGLIALQFMRSLTSLVKLVDKNGPVNFFGINT